PRAGRRRGRGVRDRGAGDDSEQHVPSDSRPHRDRRGNPGRRLPAAGPRRGARSGVQPRAPRPGARLDGPGVRGLLPLAGERGDGGREAKLKTKALLFDFGGTLDSDGVPWKERFHRLWIAEGETVEPADFDRAFYAADDALVGVLPSSLTLSETAGLLARGLAKELGTADPDVAARVARRVWRGC